MAGGAELPGHLGVLVGASAVTYDRRHLVMDLFVGGFPPLLRRIVDVLALASLVGFSLFASLQAWAIVKVMAGNGQVGVAAGIPMTVPYFAFVLGFAMVAVAAVGRSRIASARRRARCARRHRTLRTPACCGRW